MARFRIAGNEVDSSDRNFESVIAKQHNNKDRPLCLCRNPPLEMYVAKVNNTYILKRMPNTGSSHAPSCDSYEPPPELSGLGQVIGSAIEENVADGVTLLRLDFSLNKTGSRLMPPPSGKESDTVSSKGNKLTLRGVLHYLWDEAGFNRWSPAMQNKRNWFRVRKYLLHAAENKLAKGMNFADVLYIPENFEVEKKSEIAQRRLMQIMRVSAPEKGARRLMVAIGEIKGFETSLYGKKIILKHLPDFQFLISDDLYNRLFRRFDAEISLWKSEDTSHLMMIATFGVNHAGVANIEEMALMIVNACWIPYENAYDHLLLDSLIKQRRRFVRGLRYNLPSTKPLAIAVLTDMEPSPHALYITPIGASDEFVEEQKKLISESNMESWVWDATAGAMPEFPKLQVIENTASKKAESEEPLF
jgi:hypothetical protein